MKKKIFLLILVLIIVAGTIILFVAGFEKSTMYKSGTRIEVSIPKGYEKQDIINIANESFNGKEIVFEEIEKLNQIAGLRISDKYTKEEMDNFKSKISEKYKIDEEEMDVYEISIPSTRIRTDIMPYVFPVTLSTVLMLLYILFINFKNKNKWKLIFKIIAVLLLVLGLYFSFILIFRIQYSIYTMPVALSIYIITLLILTNNIKIKD